MEQNVNGYTQQDITNLTLSEIVTGISEPQKYLKNIISISAAEAINLLQTPAVKRA